MRKTLVAKTECLSVLADSGIRCDYNQNIVGLQTRLFEDRQQCTQQTPMTLDRNNGLSIAATQTDITN